MQVNAQEKNYYIEEWLRCEESPSYFALNYCHTLDVEKNEIKLFPRYQYLVDFLEENKEPQNSHYEKSRQMMISWAFMALYLWDISFKENVADFVTSRKENLVDDGGSLSTPNSLLGRVRFMWERLPSFLKMPLVFSYLKIANPVTGSFIIGESSNPNAGRSGTWHRALMDEAALIPKSEMVFSSIIQACKNGTYMNSTPYGRGGCFARIRFDKNSTFLKRRLHWSMHPERSDTWYQAQRANMTRDQIARELDISYEQSIAGQIYYMFDFSKQIGKYEYDQDLPLYLGWDFGVGNPTAVLWIQEAPIPGQPLPEIRIIDELEETEKSPPFYSDVIKAKPYKVKDDKGYLKPKDIIHFGDPAGKQRQVNMKSWISWLGELGIHIRVKHGATISECITAGQRIMPYVRVSEKCVRFQECISNYKHPTDDQGRVISDGYEENWATHIMKAFEYYAVNRFPMIKSEVRAL
jgi:hypothetical protein